MARLKQLPARLGTLPPRLERLPDDRDARRAEAQPWRAWYGTERWRRLSFKVRLAAAFTCARCGTIGGRSGDTVADHVRPHRGDPDLFWNGELICLCKPCHDGAKQREERAAR